MTEILRFEMNVPAEVVLKRPGPGKPVEGRYGNRVMYTLADDRVMYVAPIVASRITDLGIQPGERFQVRKQLKKQGSRRLIEWEVQRVAPETETPLERELRESIEGAQSPKIAQPSEVSEESNPQPTGQEQTEPLHTTLTSPLVYVSTDSSENAPEAARNVNDQIKTKLEDTVQPASAAEQADAEVNAAKQCAAPPVATLTPTVAPSPNGSANGSQSSTPKTGNNPPRVTTKLEHALKTAIFAAYNAEKYSAELGYVVRFSADAIKSMAITVLINMSEGNRR